MLLTERGREGAQEERENKRDAPYRCSARAKPSLRSSLPRAPPLDSCALAVQRSLDRAKKAASDSPGCGVERTSSAVRAASVETPMKACAFLVSSSCCERELQVVSCHCLSERERREGAGRTSSRFFSAFFAATSTSVSTSSSISTSIGSSSTGAMPSSSSSSMRSPSSPSPACEPSSSSESLSSSFSESDPCHSAASLRGRR